jgi:hypothetical protein
LLLVSALKAFLVYEDADAAASVLFASSASEPLVHWVLTDFEASEAAHTPPSNFSARSIEAKAGTPQW